MKLKKIASLALAGIMAVSMLTACGEGSNEVVNPNPNPDPTTSDVVSTFNEAMEAYVPNATVEVKESDFLNARIDKLVADMSYQELKRGDFAAIKAAVASAFKDEFGYPAMSDLKADELDQKTLAENGRTWLYDVVDVGPVSSTTALVKAANMIADEMGSLDDEFVVKGGHWIHDRFGKFNAYVENDTSYVANYTMYVYQVEATSTGDSNVPLTIAVLKVDVEQKV